MNVLKTLNENKFNDLILSVYNVCVVTPCKLEFCVTDMKHNIKKTDKYVNIPFRCILNNGENVVKITNVQNISINVPRINAMRNNQEMVSFNYGYKICTIDLLSPLTEQQLNELQTLLNSEINLNYFTF